MNGEGKALILSVIATALTVFAVSAGALFLRENLRKTNVTQVALAAAGVSFEAQLLVTSAGRFDHAARLFTDAIIENGDVDEARHYLDESLMIYANTLRLLTKNDNPSLASTASLATVRILSLKQAIEEARDPLTMVTYWSQMSEMLVERDRIYEQIGRKH